MQQGTDMAGLSKGVGAAKLFSMLEMNKHLKVRGCLRLRRTPAPTLAGNEALPLLNHHLPSSSPPQEVLPLLSELLGPLLTPLLSTPSPPPLRRCCPSSVSC